MVSPTRPKLKTDKRGKTLHPRYQLPVLNVGSSNASAVPMPTGQSASVRQRNLVVFIGGSSGKPGDKVTFFVVSRSSIADPSSMGRTRIL